MYLHIQLGADKARRAAAAEEAAPSPPPSPVPSPQQDHLILITTDDQPPVGNRTVLLRELSVVSPSFACTCW